VAEKPTSIDIDLAITRRVAEVITRLIDTYRANDPAASTSGTLAAQMRRQGRRDTALQAVALLLGHPDTLEARAKVQRAIEAGVFGD
jgi:hypothetical protein